MAERISAREFYRRRKLLRFQSALGPTPGQLRLLAELGHQGTPANQAEASALLDNLTHSRRPSLWNSRPRF